MTGRRPTETAPARPSGACAASGPPSLELPPERVQGRGAIAATPAPAATHATIAWYDVKARGMFLMGTATTVEEAVAIEKAGADCVVTQGSEAGGHRSTFAAPFGVLDLRGGGDPRRVQGGDPRGP